MAEHPLLNNGFTKKVHQIRLELGHQIFTSLDFATANILNSLACNLQCGSPHLCIYIYPPRRGGVLKFYSPPPVTEIPFHFLLQFVGPRRPYNPIHWLTSQFQFILKIR
jgi:hypothetical protein